MGPGICFICLRSMDPSQAPRSLTTAEGKYAVHPHCRAALPTVLCQGTVTQEQMAHWRDQAHVVLGSAPLVGAEAVTANPQPPWLKRRLQAFFAWGLAKCR